MTKDIFRSVNFWKSAVMMMPDNSFFELLRSVFGKIKTPFNKQQLLSDLEKFLLREDIQKTISVYIDKIDAQIIGAVSIFREPFFIQLENFFRGEYSGAQLQDIIVNLEERFILYRFSDNTPPQSAQKNSIYTGSRLALNPVLKTVLLPFTGEISDLLIKENKKNKTSAFNPAKTRVNDLIFAAIHSFILERSANFFKPEGVIRKRIMDDAKLIFPGIDFERVTGSLQALGLYYADGNALVPDYKFINSFCMLSAQERLEYFAASIIIFKELSCSAEIIPPLFKNKLSEISCLIHAFLNLIDDESVYSEKTFFKLIEALKSNNESLMKINLSNEILFDNMEETGLIIRSDSMTFKKNLPKKNISANADTITVDSGFSVLVYPEIDFFDAVKLASVLNVREAGTVPGSTVVRFELVKDSAVRSFNNNISADEMIIFFNKLSNNKVNDNLKWILKDWEKRYNEISLVKGVVLRLSPDHMYLTETHPLDEMIIETLAPGVYLLDENNLDEASTALNNAGLDIIAGFKKNIPLGYSLHYMFSESINNDNYLTFNYFHEISSRNSYYPEISNHFNDDIKNKQYKKNDDDIKPLNNSKNKTSSDKIKNEYLLKLEKMKLGDIEKSELSARINRKIILCDAQLKDAEIRYEKLEARHMDYAGKQNVAKTAISQGSPVEIVLSGKRNEEHFYGIPQSLEKEGNEIIIVVRINSAHQDAKTENADSSSIIKRIPLAKINLLRRIKKSIFEN